MTEQLFENGGVSVTLEWTHTDSTYSYHIAVVPYLLLNFSTSTRVQMKVPYNSAYNVSVLASSCGQNIVTIFFKEVFYGELKLLVHVH